ncbi:glutamine-hydrolyzing carbamoyl-phosphate synthase small subunit [Alicyclobacillus dauci]|uniref:Carbamoyl phosphate synthase small chain n=1 Tax=Alicyclobacillus dauci TaxID=1475485 RepID=A0ABY6Z0L8_9BACL|nr:glutamine-hydrolyzing carbamoyl-phosphate synthase small subunit [Alicyclobacillus dauci]WAH35510.1 glutamine-hydrolyzing carbamoyl-phosphate synthase small subunit [Alicyclobacillus dauci]
MTNIHLTKIHRPTARLILESGLTFTGTSFGATGERFGEVVFNTGMTGYQEILTDPSYYGQIVTMTYPLIGNYGINVDDVESHHPHVRGFIVREFASTPSHFKQIETLENYLVEHNIIGLSGIDTRQLTKAIRSEGAMRAVITTSDAKVEELLSRMHEGTITDAVKNVTTKTVYRSPGQGFRVVLVDYGAKSGILRSLLARGCDVIVVPGTSTAREILAWRPDGVMLSNGPGNPEDVPFAVEALKGLLGEVPVFGICLGHQLLALACGAKTIKMKFGHRGSNHPVKHLSSGRVDITAQNHGYVVDPESLSGTPLTLTHINLNDGTVEGLAHKYLPAFSVQYHPEARPGPTDASYLFDEFTAMMTSVKEGSFVPCQDATI